MSYGPHRLLQELQELGYEARIEKEEYVVISKYEILSGRFAGRVIELGFHAPANYPHGIHSSIQVLASPQLYDKIENISNVRNICNSPLGSEWRYWSLNLGEGFSSHKHASRLMSLVQGVFDRAQP